MKLTVFVASLLVVSSGVFATQAEACHRCRPGHRFCQPVVVPYFCPPPVYPAAPVAVVPACPVQVGYGYRPLLRGYRSNYPPIGWLPPFGYGPAAGYPVP